MHLCGRALVRLRAEIANKTSLLAKLWLDYFLVGLWLRAKIEKIPFLEGDLVRIKQK